MVLCPALLCGGAGHFVFFECGPHFEYSAKLETISSMRLFQVFLLLGEKKTI